MQFKKTKNQKYPFVTKKNLKRNRDITRKKT